MVKAVIDLGTNTFHLLIAETDERSYINPVCQERVYVFLASDGIRRISLAAEDRAIKAVQEFQEKIKIHNPDKILVSGTEAFRKAENGPKLSRRISKILDADVRILSGEEEAMMIGKSVQLAMHPIRQNGIAVDIGGGSTELVSLKSGKSLSVISKPCGIAYLYNRFHQEEPISASGLEMMKEYISSCFSDFIDNHLASVGTGGSMIGVAGTFEVLGKMCPLVDHVDLTENLLQLDRTFIAPLIREVVTLDLPQRERIKDLPEERAMYFLEGLMIMDQIWQLHPFESFCISSYSIKHGLMVSNF